MSEFTVDLETGSGFYVDIPPGVTLVPVWYDGTDTGGPNQAEITVTGDILALWGVLSWLGYRVTIRNVNGAPVWWGIVEQAEISSGNVQVGLSLKDMANSVKIAYTQQSADGAYERETTAAATDADSIDRYGLKERQFSLSDASAGVAESKRDASLATLSRPLPTVTMNSGVPVEATLSCIGYVNTLDWEYYARTDGKEEFTGGGTPQSLGAGAGPSTVIGFQAENKIVLNTGDAMPGGSKFRVTGSASNNGTFTVATPTAQTAETYTASTITFSESGYVGSTDDDVYDSANGLAVFAEDDIVQVEGSALNDGIYRIKTAGAAALEVGESVLSYEAAGASVTMRRRSYVTTVEALSEEDAGAGVTIEAWGIKVAQQFTQEINANWTAARVALRLSKSGAPTDAVKVALHADSAGAPGAELDSGTIAAADIRTVTDWVEVDLSNTQLLSFGTNYWIVLSRTGSNSLVDYYTVDVDETAGYTLGTMRLWDGAAWQARWTDADMAFRVLGAEETTAQIDTMATGAGRIADVEIIDASGVYANQYRAGDNTALDETLALLDAGALGGTRLIAEVTPERVLRVETQAATSLTGNLVLHADGRLEHGMGTGYERGQLPYARWVTLADVPSVIGHLADVSPFYVSRAQYDVSSGSLSLEPQGVPSPWEVNAIAEG